MTCHTCRNAIVIVLASLFGLSQCLRAQSTTAPTPPSEVLKAYLRIYLGSGRNSPPDTTTRATAVVVKLGDGKTEETIVYISGQDWCGSGGCTMLVLEPVGTSFKVLGRVTIVQLPIAVLPSTHNGYPDIGVGVGGGGIQPGYEAVLSFNGKKYPGNPSVSPARKSAHVRGRVLIAGTEGSVALYD